MIYLILVIKANYYSCCFFTINLRYEYEIAFLLLMLIFSFIFAVTRKSTAFDILHHVRPNSLRQGMPATRISYLNMGTPELLAKGIHLCGSYEAYSNHHHALKVRLLIGRDPDFNVFPDHGGLIRGPVRLD